MKALRGAALKTHDLKCWPEYFEALRNGSKDFDLRKDDRGFAVGDWLRFYEWAPETGYTGELHLERIAYILRDFEGLVPGYCILGLGLEE